MTETYADRKSREAAEADAYRVRGSKLARKLLALYLAIGSAQGPKATDVANARFNGACIALAAEHGWTETAWHLAVSDSLAANPSIPLVSAVASGAVRLEYLAWEADVAEAIDAAIAKIR